MANWQVSSALREPVFLNVGMVETEDVAALGIGDKADLKTTNPLRISWNGRLMTDTDARRIAQDFLDRQGEATISGDVEATLNWCDLPCTLESMEGRAVVTTRPEMRAICVDFIKGLKAKRITHLVRHCLEAKFSDADTICAVYETRYVRDNHLLTEEAYAGFVMLRRRGGAWKISTIQFAVSGGSPANVILRDRMRDRDEGQEVGRVGRGG